MIKIDEEQFIKVCQEAHSMAQAAQQLGLHFNTFVKYAKKFGCYKPNPSGKGFTKKRMQKIKTQDILEGKYPGFSRKALKRRLLKEHVLEDCCALCGWAGKRPDSEFTTCELHHIDGDESNNSLDNLIMLCPNCHSLTSNYRGAKKSAQKETSEVEAG